MSVIISVIGADQASDEYQGALRLKSILEKTLPSNAIGKITLHANTTIFGQEVRDIDILMIGSLQNYTEKLRFRRTIVDKTTGERRQESTEGEVEIRHFCTSK